MARVVIALRSRQDTRLRGVSETALRPLSICHIDAEREFSGGEVQVFLLMHGLRARGQRSCLIAPRGSQALLRARREGFDVREVALRSDLDLPSVLRATSILRDLSPDLVHLHTGRAAWLGGLAAWRAQVPAIVTRRMDREVRRGWRTRLVYERFTRKVAAISESVAQALVAGGVPNERIVVIPSSIDPAVAVSLRTRAQVRAELGIREERMVVLTLGSLVRRKGLDVLFAALAELRRSAVRPAVWIAGDGEERAGLESLARELGLEEVRFLGRRDDVWDLLCAADVFAMPSRREGLGVAALESFAAGCAVVASRVGGLAEVVEDQVSGLCVPAEDPHALALALERLLGDRDLRLRLVRGGRARIEARYHADKMVAAYESLYRDVLAQARGNHR